MSVKDDRRESLTTSEQRGPRALHGLRLVLALAALASNSLAYAVEPGEAVIDGKKQQFAGRASVSVYSGSTLADGSSIRSACVVWYNAELDKMFLASVDGAAATTGSDVAPTDAQIEAALPAGAPYTLAGVARFSRSGSAISVSFDHTARSLGANPGTDGVCQGTNAQEQAGDSGGMYRFFQRLQIHQTAIVSGAGDRITSYPLPPIKGKIGAMRAVISIAPVGVGGTMLLNAEIDGTNVTGGVVTVATGDAVGAVKAGTAITAANTFSPGSVLDIEAATVTAMTAGEFTLELDIYEAV